MSSATPVVWQTEMQAASPLNKIQIEAAVLALSQTHAILSDGHGRRDHDRDRGHDRRARDSGRGRVRDRDPIYGRARRGHVSLPNSRYRSARHRDEARPSEHLHRVAGSNSLHASDSDLRRDTSSRRSRRIRARVVQGRRRQHVVRVAHQYGCQPIFAR
jgi:hypothetical protein